MNQDNKITSEQINRIVIDADPIGLIQAGAPEDEYKPEISQIILFLEQPHTLDSLSENIHQVFIKAFDQSMAADQDKYKAIAQKLIQLEDSQDQ